MKTEILKCAIFTPAPGGRWGLPLLVEDAPGVAKTAYVRQLGEAWGLHVETLSPSARGEGAFGVVPVPVKGRLTYPAPDWADDVAEAGIVFVDEITTVSGYLQAPLLGLVADRQIGSHQLGPRVRVIGACNPPDLAANGHDLAPALANRFGHLTWGAPSVDEHAAYMLGQAERSTPRDASQEEARVMAAWPEAYAKAVGLEVAFLQSQPQHKNERPNPADPKASRAYASDRTWEYATRALAAAEVHGLGDGDRDEYVSAFIGRVAHEAWATFLEHVDLPRPADVLDGKVTFTWEKNRMDRCAAIVTACAALIVPTAAARRVERASTLWQILGEASAYDVTVPAIQALVRAGLSLSKEAMPVLAKINPVLRAAGVQPGQVL